MLSIKTLGALSASLLLIPSAAAWEIGLWQTGNMCSNNAAADTSRSGEPGESNDCMLQGFPEPKAILIKDWDEGCKVHIYAQTCSDEPTYTITRDDVTLSDDGSYACINFLDGKVGEPWQFMGYVCDE